MCRRCVVHNMKPNKRAALGKCLFYMSTAVKEKYATGKHELHDYTGHTLKLSMFIQLNTQ